MSDNFPILTGFKLSQRNKTLVPWSFVEQCRKQADINHGQTLERLAERGGLSYSELFMALAGERYNRIAGYPNEEKARAVILALIERPDRDALKPAEVLAIGIAEGVIIART